MTADLILHIGANKTGSSSIQSFMQKNKVLLSELGYIVADKSLGLSDRVTGEHVFALQAFLTGKRLGDKRLKTKIDKIIKSRAKASQKILLSAENIGTVQGAKLFKKTCDAYKTKVIFYIRRQDELIASGWQQWHSKRATDYDGYLLMALKTQGNWEAVINAWEKTVGPKNISIQVFEREHFPRENIIYDFIEKIGATDHTDNFEVIEQESNPSFFEYITPLVAGNKSVFQSVHDNEFYRMVQNLTGDAYSKGKKYSLMSRAQRDSIMHYFAGQNERIRKKYFPKSKTLFSPIKHGKYVYLTQEEMSELQLKFLTHMVFEIGRRTV